jgi:hypothetical protein
MKAFFYVTTCLVLFALGTRDVQADQASPAPQSPNQIQMNRDTTEPKASIVGVKPNQAGPPPNGHAGLDPSNGSGAGLGIQIPLGGSDDGAGKGAAAPEKDKTDRDNE